MLLNVICRKWMVIDIEDASSRSHLMAHTGDHEISKVHAYLMCAAQRSTSDDRPCDDPAIFSAGSSNGKGKRSPSVVTDPSAITSEDATKIADAVDRILNYIDECTLNGQVGIELLRRAGISDDELEGVLKWRDVSVVVADLHQRGEIDYGWHWLRNWYPIWCVKRWDGGWWRAEIEGRVIEADGNQSAAEKLQSICRSRCKEKVKEMKEKITLRRRFKAWTDFKNIRLYYA